MSYKSETDRSSAEPSGWVAFAAIMMIVAGFFQMVAGLVAIFKPAYYVTTASHTLVFDYTQWGWLHLLIGLVLALSASSLLAGRLWGRILAITLATLSAVANFGFIWAYPIWSIMIIIIDIMVIFSVLKYNGEADE